MSTARTISETPDATRAPGDRLRGILREAGTLDWILLVYHSLLIVAVLQGQRTNEWSRSLLEMSGLLIVLITMLVLVRGNLIKDQRTAGLLYRVSVMGLVETSYFFMRRMLPLANPRALDQQLHQFDLNWFGVEPAVAMQAWISPTSGEWFAFFYYLYFYMVVILTVTVVVFGKNRQAVMEYGLGMLMVFCTGHVLYMLVPGYGPGVAMPEIFSVPLPNGPWMQVMLSTVELGGSQKDIFPSIHTAVPTFFSLWAFRYRWTRPYRYFWPVVTFISVNIITATMFLRWHYLVDVVAGLLLGSLGLLVSIPLTRWELKRRKRLGLRPAWPEWGAMQNSAPTE